MNFLPIALNIDNQQIMIIGGGRVALEKLRTLSQYTSNLIVIAPEISESILQSEIVSIQKFYEKSDLDTNPILVYACTNNPTVNQQIKDDAHAKGILVNVADSPKDCDFVSPAVFKKDNMSIAISSNGKEVKKAIAWRNIVKRIFGKSENTTKGKVYFVGAGAGSLDLLTLKALHLLKNTEVLLYDDLLSEEIVNLFEGEEKIYVGKRKNNHSASQEEINELLVKYAQLGKSCLRLKGGDPAIFGRLGEEIEILIQHQIPFEVVAGITAASAAAALCNIPLTQRFVSSSVAFLSGHTLENLKVVEADTLVYYMAASNAYQIANQLITSGREPQTPVLIVYNVSLPTMTQTFTNLSEIAQQKIIVHSPSVLIIGNVIKCRNL